MGNFDLNCWGKVRSTCSIGWKNLYFCQIATFSSLTQKRQPICSTFYIFEVKGTIADINTELPCLGYLQNTGQLPVQGWLKGTDDCILWIFTNSSLFMFSRSKNPLLTFLLSYHVSVTSKTRVIFRFERYWCFCLINFWNFHTIHIFEVREFIADISSELPCSSDLGNPGRLPVQKVLGGDCVSVDIRNFFTFYIFEVREFFADNPIELQCLGELKNSGHLPVQEDFEITRTFIPWQKWPELAVVRKSKDVHTIKALLSTLLSCHVMSRHVTSCHVMSRHVTPCHFMPRHVMSRHLTSCHVMSHHVTSCSATSCHVKSRHVTSCHIESRGTVTRPTLFCPLTFSSRN